MLYVFVVTGILTQIILLLNAISTQNVYRENEALAKKYLDNQKEHYLYLEKREFETKKFRHDIRNHMFLLQSMMEKKDYENAEHYLSTLNERVNTFGNSISVNNGIADAVLNKFYHDAFEKEITLKVNGHLPLDCYVSAFDMCTILSNLLSNAIDAEYEFGGHEVDLDIRYSDTEIFLVIENDYVHELQAKEGLFKTTKQDDFEHGLGLSNVRDCVEKNEGHLLITTDNHRFKVMISLRNEQKEQI